MKIQVLNTPEEVDRRSAEAILRQIESRPCSVVGLSTGRTTCGVHKALVELCREKRPDLSKVTFFGIDEIAGVPREYSGACYTMLKTQVIDPLGIKDDNFLMLPTYSADFPADCARFTEELSRRGGIDFILLGLGENAHLGFNQPGTPFDSGCRVAEMTPELEQRVRRETATPDETRLGGVTLGLADIFSAGKLVLAAKGCDKAPAVKAMAEVKPSEKIPASVLQLHSDVTILIDREAASLL
ncbi:MAG: glucosamine-6-phosphate deaminase [Bacteroidales bacterium]|nr:glucosamine-6-phosphate deaminase [Bacteroidales bacterium]